MIEKHTVGDLSTLLDELHELENTLDSLAKSKFDGTFLSDDFNVIRAKVNELVLKISYLEVVCE